MEGITQEARSWNKKLETQKNEEKSRLNTFEKKK
jgi:hypothetical protein